MFKEKDNILDVDLINNYKSYEYTDRTSILTQSLSKYIIYIIVVLEMYKPEVRIPINIDNIIQHIINLIIKLII